MMQRSLSLIVKHAQKVLADRMRCPRAFLSSKGCGIIGYNEQAPSRSVQVQIVDALRSGKRDRASNMLSCIEHNDGTLKAADFEYILDYCSRAPDPLAS
ncbi:Pentatricopeptide repeat-containing protein [Acorus calamus]|uniref:Pentatricopeptide repeat-containing protein n=1 Tax=Acorus calamus TaxID=4465 RepID=A0AAV9EWG5_ACOCL|nr:Pentatricopeptide repeat-containing protein [Acorus calamus]